MHVHSLFQCSFWMNAVGKGTSTLLYSHHSMQDRCICHHPHTHTHLQSLSSYCFIYHNKTHEPTFCSCTCCWDLTFCIVSFSLFSLVPLFSSLSPLSFSLTHSTRFVIFLFLLLYPVIYPPSFITLFYNHPIPIPSCSFSNSFCTEMNITVDNTKFFLGTEDYLTQPYSVAPSFTDTTKVTTFPDTPVIYNNQSKILK